MILNCPECGKRLHVRDELAGKKGKCPGCGAVLRASGLVTQTPERLALAGRRRAWVWIAGGTAIAALVAGLLVLAITDRNDQERAKLVQQLLETGRQFGTVPYAGAFARRYGADDALIERYRGPQDGSPHSLDTAEIAAAERAIWHMRPEYLENWPASIAPEMELVELRILLDQSLVGNLKYTRFAFRESCAGGLFLHTPTASVSDVRAKHGEPTGEKVSGDAALLTYGRLRMVADDAGQVVSVFSMLFEEDTPH